MQSLTLEKSKLIIALSFKQGVIYKIAKGTVYNNRCNFYKYYKYIIVKRIKGNNKRLKNYLTFIAVLEDASLESIYRFTVSFLFVSALSSVKSPL